MVNTFCSTTLSCSRIPILALACTLTCCSVTTEISEADWNQKSADWTLLPSEPFPFQAKHLAAFQAMGKKPVLVDGEAFSWYGSRMAHAATYLESLAEKLQP